MWIAIRGRTLALGPINYRMRTILTSFDPGGHSTYGRHITQLRHSALEGCLLWSVRLFGMRYPFPVRWCLLQPWVRARKSRVDIKGNTGSRPGACLVVAKTTRNENGTQTSQRCLQNSRVTCQLQIFNQPSKSEHRG